MSLQKLSSSVLLMMPNLTQLQRYGRSSGSWPCGIALKHPPKHHTTIFAECISRAATAEHNRFPQLCSNDARDCPGGRQREQAVVRPAALLETQRTNKQRSRASGPGTIHGELWAPLLRGLALLPCVRRQPPVSLVPVRSCVYLFLRILTILRCFLGGGSMVTSLRRCRLAKRSFTAFTDAVVAFMPRRDPPSWWLRGTCRGRSVSGLRNRNA